MNEEIEEQKECDHIYDHPDYMCKLCGYDCTGLEIDRSYGEIEDYEEEFSEQFSNETEIIKGDCQN